MTGTSKLPVEIICRSGQLDVAVREMAGVCCIALDTESNSFHHYPEQLCLIQIATGDKVYVIDTITLEDISPLKEALSDDSIVKIIHGADYDIRSLDRHSGLRIHNLYDTAVAARFAGIVHFGLAALICDLLGVTIEKNKRLQRANWGLRPLSDEALDYATSDVRYLFALHDMLVKRVDGLGRTEWVAEECARLEEVRYHAPELENAYLALDGARNLDGRGLAILRNLFFFRDAEARRQHRPPFFVMPDSALIFLAMCPLTALSDVPGLGQIAVQRFGRGLKQALSEGIVAPLVERPSVGLAERMTGEQVRRLNRLKDWRSDTGNHFSLDPSLLWPASSLERIARSPEIFDEELTSPNIRRWQREQFGAALRSLLNYLT